MILYICLLVVFPSKYEYLCDCPLPTILTSEKGYSCCRCCCCCPFCMNLLLLIKDNNRQKFNFRVFPPLASPPLVYLMYFSIFVMILKLEIYVMKRFTGIKIAFNICYKRLKAIKVNYIGIYIIHRKGMN